MGKLFTVLTVCILLFVAFNCHARVYVYEVITADTTFHTASKLEPYTFLKYNGGEDIVLQLKVLKVYPDSDFKTALRDYGLEKGNIRQMPHSGPDNNTVIRRPFYWWR
jgi:hypothetical protein